MCKYSVSMANIAGPLTDGQEPVGDGGLREQFDTLPEALSFAANVIMNWHLVTVREVDKTGNSTVKEQFIKGIKTLPKKAH